MERRRYRNMFFIIIFMTSIYVSNGCQMEGVNNWLIPVSTSILDVHRGNVLDRSTSSIEGINTIIYGEGINRGPYLDVSYANSRFVIATNAAYEDYEEYETTDSMAITVNFWCTGGSSSTLVLLVNVIDTNNNAPQFRPSDQYVFTVAPPLPPGFMITGCLNDITVRDIDLTTQRIDFEIEDNPYFEIAYDAASSTEAKEFKAILRTTTFIRSLPEPVTVRITATDVDGTNDPPLSTSATVTIVGDADFEFPEEPVFSQAFYLANYTDDDYLLLQESITLESGYHETIQFTLEGEYANNFELVQNENLILLNVIYPLSIDVFAEKQIFLVVRAAREYTSGGAATIIVRFPEDVVLQFERAHYEGTIENNALQVPPLVLTQGYEGGSVSVIIISEYSTYFNAVIESNTIRLTMSPLTENIIEENSFLNLQVNAVAARSLATAVITLDIIKDDNVTPVFNRPIYEGSYNSDTGLTIEQIVIVQGYDETVSVSIEGDYAEYFQLIQNGSVLVLTASTISPEIYAEKRILLSVEATKPRTVGASAAVIITLPAARELDFEQSTYRGTLQDNVINLQPIVLTEGYDESVIFSLTGDHASYFSVSNMENRVSVSLIATIPESIILENNIVILTLTASGLNALTTTTSVLLDVIKDDMRTPVFASNIYLGNYISPSVVDIGSINLIQGFDDTVTFRLDGDHSQYFEISNTGNNVALSLRSAIPEDVIFNEKVLLFNVIAEKPLTVSANTAILIKFPIELTDSAVLRFSENTYTGTMENDVLTTENIELSIGYSADVVFLLSGEYSAYFTLTNINNVVSISLSLPLPSDIVENSSFIVLEIEARRERAVSVWSSLVIDIIKQDVIPLVFTDAYYTGVYSNESGLQIEGEISLSTGYDESVSFGLGGEFASYFNLTQRNNLAELTTLAPLPDRVLEDNSHLLLIVSAYKPNVVTARATISIDILKNANEIVILRFAENSYVGAIQNNQLQLPTIILNGTHDEDVNLDITGDYASYFSISRVESEIRIELTNSLPSQLIEENTFITLELSASYPGAVSGVATIVMEIIKEQTLVAVFERAYYTGEYSEQTGLVLEHTISLVQGFDETVSFTLDGDDAQWFTLVHNGPNNISLSVIESGVPENRSHLVLSVVATQPESSPIHAPIIISITDFSTGRRLQFTQNYYVGTLEGITLTLDSLSLEGYTSDVIISLTGDYANYFQLTNQGGIFTLLLSSELPDETAASKVLILAVEAQIGTTRTHTTIVLEILNTVDIGVDIGFEEDFYVGTYSVQEGFIFDSPIRLTGGINSSVSYSLEGDQAQWFSIFENENSVTIVLTNSIPIEVQENNSHLIFFITAESSGSTIARATIIISLLEDYAEELSILGFDRVTYVGSIQNDTANLGPIILNEGYTDDVSFRLFGELSSYFNLTSQGSVVTVGLQTAIPEEFVPTNRIVLLEIQASAPRAVSAAATIVLEFLEDDSTSSVEDPVFDKTYYTGTYSISTGLIFETPITLNQAYETNVQFGLEGENSQWFDLVQDQNSVTLILSSPIPAAVLANNRQFIFVITAQRTGSNITRATIVITLTDEFVENSPLLAFDRVTYVGSIQNTTVSGGPITLIEGYNDNVTFNLFGELSNYFNLITQGNVVNITLQSAIPEQLVPANKIVVLEIQASAPQVVSAFATIVFEMIIEDETTLVVQPVFEQAYYTGSYNTNMSFIFPAVISLAQGYETDVEFSLEGEHSQWFGLTQTQNVVTLTLTTPIPTAVLANNRQLIFTVIALKPEALPAQATIIITITDDKTEEIMILGFDRVTYIGSIQGNTTTIGPITLIEGYTDNVTFRLFGELASFFTLTTQGAVVTVSLQTSIPEHIIPTNGIIILEIQASAPQTLSSTATIVFEVIEDEAIFVVEPAFENPYYTGFYNSSTGLVFETVITLAQGYTSDIRFNLQGEHSQWFSLMQNGNSVTLTLSTPIPSAVLANNRQLIFVISAQAPETTTSFSTIIIAITDDYTEDALILGFDRVTYIGTVQNNSAIIEPITLIEGYTDNVNFILFGDLSNYFSLAAQGPIASISLEAAIPEELIPSNKIIVLEIQASAPQAFSASATIVFNVVLQDNITTVIQPVFNAAFYSGIYNTINGLEFETTINLSEGYGTDIEFGLEGENSQWFSLVQNQNTVTLIVSTPIPAAVLANNRQLVFVITAQRSESAIARSTIIITITDEYTEDSPILGFDRVTYIGSIQYNIASIGPITLIEGYTDNVAFRLFGELSSYFSLTTEGSVVTVALQAAIPEQQQPVNGIVVLEIQASAPQTISASATLIFEVIEEENPAVAEPVFEMPYYIGSYSTNTGLLFETPITLVEGYNTDIQFNLEGENSQWFSFVQTQNNVTLILSNPIPAAVLMNNRQLVFVITALRPGSATAHATVVISLTDDYTEEATILGFDRTTYVGSIQGNAANIGPITLIEGYNNNVSFSLFGELSSYFSVTAQGSVVTVLLQSAIPEQLIPTNRIIVLEIQASAPQTVSAYSVILLEVIIEDDKDIIVQPVFNEPYYTGSFNSNSGLIFVTAITLAQGYSEDVQFSLQGDQSQWFSLVQTENSVTLTLTSAIPAAVLTNNRQLVFVITAQKPGSSATVSTIIISLTDDYREDAPILGFDKITYIGSIQGNTTSLEAITLVEGYTDSVSFLLLGELSSYFTLTRQGSAVTVALETAIPDQLLPVNKIIVLEIQANAQQAISASATIIFEVKEDEAPAVAQPVFERPYYTGSFSTSSGLLFETPITLAEGYDADIQFSLEGDNSQWFSFVQNQNTVTVFLSSPIPTAVLMNNRQLVFVITAISPRSAALATIVISLTDDYTEDAAILGFDRTAYVGSIQGNAANIGPITLIVGYSNNVSFALFGDLSSYFSVTTQDAVITVSLQTDIPEQLIPTNKIIVLEIQASAPEAISTSAVIILEVILDDQLIVEPVFKEPYYTGSFNHNSGLVFDTVITLDQGYSEDVQFGLQGEHSQWFSLTQTQNSVTLTLTSAIPAAVLTNNRKLVFVVTAQRPGSSIALSTIIISLTDDYTEDAPILGFDRITYTGSIQDNTASIDPITLMFGYTEDVTFRLFGDLSNYFSLTAQGSVVTVALQTPIPEQLVPSNRIVLLEIQAFAPQAVSTHATIVFEVVVDDDSNVVVQPIFDAAFYTGSYNAASGLVFDTPITLSQGYGEDVQFRLEGDNSQWFSFVQNQNTVTVILSSPIPAAVLMNNRQLVFVITAISPKSAALATIVISLTDDYTEDAAILGFDRTAYVGSIQGNAANIGPITLIVGYSNNVSFALFGDLSSYFSVTTQDSVITVSLQTDIPEQLIPTNKIIVLEIQASAPEAISTSAVIILEVILDDQLIVEPVFKEPYYTGSFNHNSGLVFDTVITLDQGYSEDVQFGLQGEHSQWFSLTQTQNSVTLTLTSAIPAAVLTNNRKLVFVVTAQRPGSSIALSTIIISLTDDYTEDAPILGFDRITYTGSIQDNTASIDPITLMVGYTEDVTFRLFGDLSNYFSLTAQGSVVTVALQTPIPEQLVPSNRIVLLEIQAFAPQAVSTHATIVFEVVVDDDSNVVVQPIFDAAFYTGSYSAASGLVFDTPITLSQGYGEDVQFRLEGDNSQWFSFVQNQNTVTVFLSSPIPAAVLMNNRQLVFVITAISPRSAALATIVISLTDDYTEDAAILGFDRTAYVGSIQGNAANIGPITLIVGYSNNVSFALFGDLSSYFSVTTQDSVITVSLQTDIPEQLIPTNKIIVLEIQASAPEAISTSAVIILEVILDDQLIVEPVFKEPYYTGSFNHNSGLVFETVITLDQGYSEDVQFGLQGEHSQWFSLTQTQNSVTLTLTSGIPAAVLTNNRKLVFVVTAQRPGSSIALSTIIISLTDDYTEDAPILGFDRITYTGSIQDNTASIDPITLMVGYTEDVTFRLFGDLSNYFSLTAQGSVVTVALQTPIPEQLVPSNRIVLLEIQAFAPQAVSTHATIVFEVVVDDDSNVVVQPIFDAAFYTGSYNAASGLVFDTPITLSQGYDEDVQFRLEGENSGWFNLVQNENSLTLIITTPIPSDVLANNRKLVNIVTAERPGSPVARAVIIISLINDLQTGSDVSFEKVFYEGIIQDDRVQHETIRIPGYTGTTIAVYGEYSSLFVAYVADGVVTVQMSGSLTLPSDVTSLPLELHAAGDRAVLLLTLLQSGVPVLPSVTFSSPLYAISVELTQTGLVGRVQATADNGETLIYSLLVENAHLQSRIFINNEGELHLSAPANSGVYSFQVIATTVITQATATAMVQLSVEAITMCGEDNIVVPPLIILDRDEEEPHRNLVVLNATQYPGCEFTLTNRWPEEQTWLYVDENGLHTIAIDREHQSIAFMALSQVQVELLLHCDADVTVRAKRSERTDRLGPYDYGTNKWILTDTIQYNSRRSIVNLIVNDINDNTPIFIGKENEPIAIGYPISDLAESILPRSLAELQATDADIGENAELQYWSSESVLAVSPSTGFVHLRSGAQLEENQLLIVHATDRNGEGLTGSIQLLVKLLDTNNIVVMTVRDAFLDDEKAILEKISEAVGYDVKTLRSVVISDDMDGNNISRKKRETDMAGASLQLYVYGLVEREPVAVERLTADINNNAAVVVNVVTTVSLEDHLEACEICVIPERNTGLLVSTIVLSILLFIIIVLIALWLFLRWRKNRKYDEFSDANSLASRNDSVGSLPKPQVASKPRLNIEELRKSERRLQEILNTPIKEVPVEPTVSKRENPLESILDLSPPETLGPIVIQSIDKLKDADDDSDDDEFGQTKETRRKSVVTFNENVEKIIHVEDNPDEADASEHPGYEIYKL